MSSYIETLKGEVMNENSGQLIMVSGNGSRRQLFCENRNCQYGKVDVAYTTQQFIDLGWVGIPADKGIGSLEKASPYNPDARNEGNNLVEVYCPDCKKLLNNSNFG
jgi:hypothetical protein